MGSDYKRIVLLKGLQPIEDYHFSMVKSLLARDLGLTTKMQEEYNRIKIADLMEKKYQGPLCVDKLIDLYKDIDGFGDIVKTLKYDKKKAMKQSRLRGREPTKRTRRDAPSTAKSTLTKTEASGSTHDIAMPKKKKMKTTAKDEPTRTQPTQAQSQLPGPSAPSAQSTWSSPQTPHMPPPIAGSSSSTKKKKMKPAAKDEPMRTQPTQAQSQLPGPSAPSAQSTWSSPQTPHMPPPIAGSSSSTKKKKMKTTAKDEPTRTQPTQAQSQLPGSSAPSAQSTWSSPQTPHMPPPIAGSSSSTKEKKMKTTAKDESTWTQPTQAQSQLPGPSVPSTQSTWSSPQTPHMPPPIAGSSSSIKKEKMKTTAKDEPTRTQPTQAQSQLPGPSAPSAQSTWSSPQTPHMPPPIAGSSSSTKKPRLKAVPTEASIEEGFQKGPKEVMVLKATEPFAYDLIMEAERKMFHATVATESQFFQVKVFHVNLKEKFIPKKVIAISDYYGRNGFLELYDAACVSDVNVDQKMEISTRLIQNANATPKINTLYLQKPGTFVSGIYQVHKKNVLNEHIILYEIQDNTGKMEVLVYGRLTKVNCEEGDKLKLICFELSADPRQLRSVIHSFIKVIKSRKNKNQPLNPDSYMETSLKYPSKNLDAINSDVCGGKI